MCPPRGSAAGRAFDWGEDTLVWAARGDCRAPRKLGMRKKREMGGAGVFWGRRRAYEGRPIPTTAYGGASPLRKGRPCAGQKDRGTSAKKR